MYLLEKKKTQWSNKFERIIIDDGVGTSTGGRLLVGAAADG